MKNFKFILKAIFLTCLLLACSCFLGASNMRITNTPTFSDVDESKGEMSVNFNLRWDYSWRSDKPNLRNYDAAWVFIKYNYGGMGWNHAYLHSDSTKHAIKETNGVDGLIKCGKSKVFNEKGLALKDSVRTVGVFLYRAASGNGHINWDVSLRWPFRAQGIETAEEPITVRVFAIEMVYIPQGRFYLGDGQSTNCFTTAIDYTLLNPYLVKSENQIMLAARGSYTAMDTAITTSANNTLSTPTNVYLPKAYPKGFDAFYIMKYELTQEGWVNFLNTLTLNQQQMRVGYFRILPANIFTYVYNVQNNYTGVSAKTLTNRNGVALMELRPDQGIFGCNYSAPSTWLATDFNQNGDGQNIAMNFMGADDQLAYLDWAGLRPLTEMEYEKACRGFAEPVKGEYAWGDAKTYPSGSAPAALDPSTVGTGYEKPLTGNYNNDQNNPMRGGAFADSTTTRQQAGATYFGVMDMTGSLRIRYLNVYMPNSRNFKGDHGDGQLNYWGGPSVELSWPTSRYHWIDKEFTYTVSQRNYYNATANNQSLSYYGCRGGRSENPNLN